MLHITRTETFHYETLRRIAANTARLEIDRAGQRCIQGMLRHAKQRPDGNAELTVKYSTYSDYGRAAVGRLMAEDGVGMQAVWNRVRGAIAARYYADVDVVNAQPAILLQYVVRRQWTCPVDWLREYVNNRDRVLRLAADVIGAHGTEEERRTAAKKAVVSILYGAQQFKGRDDALGRLTEEMVAVRQLIEAANPKLVAAAAKKKGLPADSEGVARSVAAVFLQGEERGVLLAIDAALRAQGREMHTLIHDGGLVLLRKGEETLPAPLLRDVEKAVQTATGYMMRLLCKPMDTSMLKQLEGPDMEAPGAAPIVVPPSTIVDDEYAAGVFVGLMGDRITRVGEALHVFDESTGMWTSSPSALHAYVARYKDSLVFMQEDTEGKERLHNYGGVVRNIAAMLTLAAAKVPDTDKFRAMGDSGMGKLLFADGILDLDTKAFTKGFNPNILFLKRIARPYIADVPRETVERLRTLLFSDPFLAEEQVAGTYLLETITRAIYGDYRVKRFPFLVGEPNSSKGVQTAALRMAFGGFVSPFDANNLRANPRSGTDEAKQLHWTLDLDGVRLALGNEVKQGSALDGNVFKALSGGGDEVLARRNHCDQRPMVVRTTFIGMCNDIPKIEPFDKAVRARFRAIPQRVTFVDTPDGTVTQKKANPAIKALVESPEYADAYVQLVLETWEKMKSTPAAAEPDVITKASNDWSGGAGAEDLATVLKREFEFTGNPDDKETNTDIRAVVGNGYSDVKLGLALAALGAQQCTIKDNGKSVRGRRCMRVKVELDDDE
jgi:hypothetical protein